MEPTATTAEITASADAISSAITLPTPTPGVAPGVQEAAPAPHQEVLPGCAPTDGAGVPFDPRIHEGADRRKKDGTWAKKRGNAARAAKGLPLSGSNLAAGRAARAAKAEPEKRPEAPGQTSLLAPLSAAGAAAGAAADGAIQAEVAPEAARVAADYDATSSGIVLGLFGLLRICFGKAWKPEAEETRAWREAVTRACVYYQTPVLGPAVELIPLAMVTAGKRAEDPETRDKAGRLWGWLRRLLGHRQVQDQAAAPAAAAAPMSPPSPQAGSSPRSPLYP